jgi:hypothetical protein
LVRPFVTMAGPMEKPESIRWCPVCATRALPRDVQICPVCEPRISEEAKRGVAELQVYLALEP